MSTLAGEIPSVLDAIETTHKKHVLFAVESGSRAWGFESRDSDFDVRFLYHGAMSDYLTVIPKRDVIENKDVISPSPLLDFSGWDVRKFFGLINKSNPICFEWLQSTIIYRADSSMTEVRELVRPFFSPKAAMHHYLSMARHNYREHMRDGTSPSVKLKKYLYITRPLLCSRWIELDATRGAPPMPFETVLSEAEVSSEVRHALLALVDRKKTGDELDEGPAVACINRFIDTELWRLRAVADEMPVGSGRLADLDDYFSAYITKGTP